jgi:hypothetical protein
MVNSFGLGAGLPGVPDGGMVDLDQYAQFVKAVAQTTIGTDAGTKTGVGAFQPESLEVSFAKTITSNDEFKLYKRVKRTPVSQVTHMWKIQEAIGGQPGNSFNTETGKIPFVIGRERRATINLKFMMTGVNSTVFVGWTTTEPDYDSTQDTNAMLRIGESANWGGYYGSELNCPNQFDGVYRQLQRFRPQNIINLDGMTDANIVVQMIGELFAKVKGRGSYGKLTDFIVDTSFQNSLDQALYPQFRVAIDNNTKALETGAPVEKIRTSYGQIQMNQDTYLRSTQNGKMNITFDGSVPEGAPLPPAIVVTALPPGDPLVVGTKVTVTRAGAFYFKFCPVDANGTEGAPSNQGVATCVTLGGIKSVLTPNADAKATSYNAYMSTQDPSGAPTNDDYQLVDTINVPDLANPLAPITFVWKATKIAGTSGGMLTNLVPESIDYLQLGPIMKLKLYPSDTATSPRAVVAVMAPRLRIPQHHFWLEGFINPLQTWKPFKA